MSAEDLTPPRPKKVSRGNLAWISLFALLEGTRKSAKHFCTLEILMLKFLLNKAEVVSGKDDLAFFSPLLQDFTPL